jgi:hypothetical protein
MSVGVAFASTGGEKMARAARSFNKQEPDLPINIILDTSSNTWKSNPDYFVLSGLPATTIYSVENSAHINGTLNHAMNLMKERGHSHSVLFHDDLVFSPLPENRGYIQNWIKRMEASPDLMSMSGLSFGELECFVKNPGTVRHQPGHWDAPPEWWDPRDLESEEFWRKMIGPDGIPERYVDFDGFFVEYCPAGENLFGPRLRMGPTGQIVNISSWEKVGGFDETFGLHYDTDFPFACVVNNLPPILYISGAPHMHIHNQSMGYKDPSTGIWGDFERAFQRKYGKVFHDFCVEQEGVWSANPIHIEG